MDNARRDDASCGGTGRRASVLIERHFKAIFTLKVNAFIGAFTPDRNRPCH